ncbi:hypothetical protein V500_00744 [Pseudogymnoascus sp. VKM F-4518 (FW-2643)]|nr:hypothetical protein V500_00744 [Pseudogymnoascus sp. VKM F-4518 (FW-2643)]
MPARLFERNRAFLRWRVASPRRFARKALRIKFSQSRGSLETARVYKKRRETGVISQKQLIAEVKGRYVGLVMVEGKCIQVDLKQAQLAKEAPAGTQPKLNNEQYQALIALHRTLLHEHYDFFLASQHPSATDAVRRLPLKYVMPARLWRHAIHSFLELLRNGLPASLEYMLEFIYLAYSMMTLLLETVPAFEDTWIECLGDLGRYRMAIEDNNVRDREIWAQVARQWYLKSANRSPITGRLYHHLAILARPDALPQLLYYGKSLAVPDPFTAARESIMTLFEPTLNPVASKSRFSTVITAIVRSHAIIFTGQSLDTFDETLGEIKSNLLISPRTKKDLEQGYYIAISNCIALLGYGADDNPLALLLKPQSRDQDTIMSNTNSTSGPALPPKFTAALRLFIQTTEIHLLRIGDINTLSFLHVTLVFIRHLSRHPSAASLIYPHFPWSYLVCALNALTLHYPPNRTTAPLDPSQLEIAGTYNSAAPAKNSVCPFPEELAMRGLSFTSGYFPDNYFANENVEPETHYLSIRLQHRPKRVLWLGVRLAELAVGWLGYAGAGGGGEGSTFFVGEKAKECFDGDAAEAEGGSGSTSGSETEESKARWSESRNGTMEIDDALAREEEGRGEKGEGEEDGDEEEEEYQDEDEGDEDEGDEDEDENRRRGGGLKWPF